MFLGIEIGGTKLQLGVGDGRGPRLVALERFNIVAARGAEAIREQILAAARRLAAMHDTTHIGIGFGGPVAADGLRVVRSHQVAGWEGFPLVDWCRDELGLPAVLGNDADLAGLAEARFGAGRGYNPVFYITVGTGIGGGLIVDGHVNRGSGHGAAEIGHLRPGPEASDPHATVESRAAGPGIVATVHRTMAASSGRHVDDLAARAGRDTSALTARIVGEAAANGNEIALAGLRESQRVLGWAIAQVITLVAPAAVVVGGGVSLLGEALFFAPLRREVDTYVFPPFRGTYKLLPAELGEEMVIYGALALAAEESPPLSRA
jgi:glucokinase